MNKSSIEHVDYYLMKFHHIQKGGYGVANKSDDLTNLHTEYAEFKLGDDIVVQPGTFPKGDVNENYSSNYGILGETIMIYNK